VSAASLRHRESRGAAVPVQPAVVEERDSSTSFLALGSAGRSSRMLRLGRLRNLSLLFQRHPDAFLNETSRLLDVQKDIVRAMDGHDDSFNQVVESRRQTLLTSLRQNFALEPRYPIEMLLDVETLEDADDYILKLTNASQGEDSPVNRTSTPSLSSESNKSSEESLSFVGACYTHVDPRVEQRLQVPVFGASPAAAGRPCLFGVTPADEGSHCVYDGGKYGSFGWCYTEPDRTEWGSCSEDCPSAGNVKILNERIDHLMQRVQTLLAVLQGSGK